MIDGKYSVELDTPLGRKKGTVGMRTQGDAFFAVIDAPLIKNQQVEGRVDGDAFTAEGAIKLKLVGKLDYKLNGEVAGDDLHIRLDTSKGAFEVTGKRI